MRLLIDSHALIWYVDQDQLLSRAAHASITDPNNDLYLSAATIWEIAIKVGVNKLRLSAPYLQWISKAATDLGLVDLPITMEFAGIQTGLPHYHRDPFDRMLVAQAIGDKLSIVSNDAIFDQYGVTRVW